MSEFDRRRGATIVFSDVIGNIPLGHAEPTVDDFDARLTDDARNKGRFIDREFGIGAWPEIGEYGAVLIEQLREEQFERAKNEGIDTDNLKYVSNDVGLHPDLRTLAASINDTVAIVVNHAPRTKEHHASGENGDEFFAGITHTGLQVFAQLPYFRGLRARGALKRLLRIPNESGLWLPKEQYRSSSVTQARVHSELLCAADIDLVPPIDLDGRVAYADTFGNVRLEVKDVKLIRDLLADVSRVRLKISHKAGELVLAVGQSLHENRQNQPTIYFNPADKTAGSGPAYLEIANRVDDPVRAPNHAYALLCRLATGGAGILDPRDWNKLNVKLDA